MCEPTLITAGAMAAVSAFSTYQQNRQQAAAYDSQADAYANTAHQQIQQGASEAYQQTRQARSAAATQTAAIGANGVMGNTGSALRTIQDTFAEGQDAAGMTQQNAYNQATTSQYQSNIARASAKNTRKNNLATSLLTGAGTFAQMGGISALSNTGGSSIGAVQRQKIAIQRVTY